MESKLLDRLGQTFRVEMPVADTLDSYLNAILPKVRPWSEDLREVNFFLNKPWIEIKDDDTFHDIVIHIFDPESRYYLSQNGTVSGGRWKILPGNKLLILYEDDDDTPEYKGELFDLAFLDSDFFILRKSGASTFRFWMVEGKGRSYKDRWRDAVELLFKKSQSNISFYILIAAAVIMALMIFLVLR